MKVKIRRLEDGLEKQGELSWIKYKMDGNYTVDKPEEGCSLCLDAGWNYTWLTSPVKEVISQWHIKTKNSEYKIWKI